MRYEVISHLTACVQLYHSLIALGIVVMFAAQTSNFEVREATIEDIHAALRARRLTCVQLVQKYLDRIDAYDRKGPAINAIITINPNALVDARLMDAEIAQAGVIKPLHCIPMVVKDNFETLGLQTTAGSLSLAGWISHRRSEEHTSELQSRGLISY